MQASYGEIFNEVKNHLPDEINSLICDMVGNEGHSKFLENLQGYSDACGNSRGEELMVRQEIGMPRPRYYDDMQGKCWRVTVESHLFMERYLYYKKCLSQGLCAEVPVSWKVFPQRGNRRMTYLMREDNMIVAGTRYSSFGTGWRVPKIPLLLKK